MRPSSPRSSRISSTTARYSRSSSRVLTPGGSSSGCSCTSTRSRPCASVWAAPAVPRCRPTRLTAPTPPGRRTRSATSATVPTLAYSPSWRGTSSTRSSSPTSAEIVTFMFGKTTMSSSGTSSRVLTIFITFLSVAIANRVATNDEVRSSRREGESYAARIMPGRRSRCAPSEPRLRPRRPPRPRASSSHGVRRRRQRRRARSSRRGEGAS